MSHNLIRVESPTIVKTMASVNHVVPTVSPYAASVTLADVIYFWAAA